MPRYRNARASILGLSLKGTKDERSGRVVPAKLRTVMPGEVFEAEKDQVPEVYLQQRWLVPTSDPITTSPESAPGVTDQEAALSGAYGDEAKEQAMRTEAQEQGGGGGGGGPQSPGSRPPGERRPGQEPQPEQQPADPQREKREREEREKREKEQQHGKQR